MAANILQDDLYVKGNIRGTSFTFPAGEIAAVDIAAAAGIEASKLQQQHSIRYSQPDGSDVVAAIVPVHIVRGAAVLLDVEVVCLDAPSGGDKTFTVDVGSSNAAGPAPATILSSVRTYPNGTADSVVLTATHASPTPADGDTLTVTVATSGSTGIQGQGLIVTITLLEAAN